jgi:ribosomal protein L24
MEIKEGDTVIVDEGYRNGGYEALVVTVYGKHFARIRHEDEEWDIMKNRLKLK